MLALAYYLHIEEMPVNEEKGTRKATLQGELVRNSKAGVKNMKVNISPPDD